MGVIMNQRYRDLYYSARVLADFDMMIRENFRNHPDYHLFINNTGERQDMYKVYVMGRSSV